MIARLEHWAGRRVAVTGGTGFLGYHLARRLVELGADVQNLSLAPRDDHPLLELGRVRNFFGDVRDGEIVGRALAGCDVVFHTAGIVAVWGPALERMASVHREGTRQVIANAGTARVVHTSSIVAVGASRDGAALDENCPFNAGSLRMAYVDAKRESEEFALAAASKGRDVVVVNPGYLVGPEDHEPSIMGRFCVRFWKGRIPLAPPGGVNFVDVRDVVEGHLLAAERGEAGRRYILGGENRTFREWMGVLARVGGMQPRAAMTLPGWTLQAIAGLAEVNALATGREPYPSFEHVRLNQRNWFVRSTRAEQELGYRARPLEETLAETYAWFASRGQTRLRGIQRWWMRPKPVRPRPAPPIDQAA